MDLKKRNMNTAGVTNKDFATGCSLCVQCVVPLFCVDNPGRMQASGDAGCPVGEYSSFQCAAVVLFMLSTADICHAKTLHSKVTSASNFIRKMTGSTLGRTLIILTDASCYFLNPPSQIPE
jgi:hypothetical protein